MKKLEKIKNLIENVENQPINFEKWLILFTAIIFIRLFEEIFLNLKRISFDNFITNSFIWHDFVHIFLIFFFFNIIAFLIFQKTLKLKLSAFMNLSLVATFFISILPPFLDFLISYKYKLINFYEFYSIKEFFINFFTFMQQDPLIGTTPGQRIGIFASLILIGFYSFIKNKNLKIVLLNVFLFYSLFFIILTLPSIITFLIKGIHSQSFNVASLFFSPIDLLNQKIISVDISLHKKIIFIYLFLISFTLFFVFIKNKIFQSLLKNIRITQTLYHIGCFLIGLNIAIFFRKAIFLPNFFNFLALFLIIISIIFLWFSSVIVNDYFDKEIDKITNKNRPLIQKIISDSNYLKIAYYLFFISILISLLINFSITIFFCFYYALSLAYNVPPLRLKKFFGIATFISAIASIIILFIGYLIIVPENNLQNFPANIIYLILISFTISLPLKDFKDIEGDKNDKIWTLPVIFGEKNGRLILGFNFFISFLLSVYFLREKKLISFAIFFGILSFLLINLKNKENYLFTRKKIIPITFCLVFFYGISLVYIIFKNNIIEFFKF